MGEAAAEDAATRRKWGATGARTARAAGSPQSLSRTSSAARAAGAGLVASPAASSHAQQQKAEGMEPSAGAEEDTKGEIDGVAPADEMVVDEEVPAPEVAAPQAAARPSGGTQKRRPR